MKPSTIVMSGASLADTCFVLDRRICGEEICWNVTRIERAAKAGAFGKPWRIPMANLPPTTDEDRANVDWKKVLLFAEWPAVMSIPIISIGAKEPGHIFCFIDGNHRLFARMERKLLDFETWVVPHDVERRYRITTTTGGT